MCYRGYACASLFTDGTSENKDIDLPLQGSPVEIEDLNEMY